MSFQIKLVMVSRDTIVISAVSATVRFLTCLFVVNTQDKQIGDLSLLGLPETNTPNSEEEDKNQLDNSASPPLHCDQGDDLLNLLSRCLKVKTLYLYLDLGWNIILGTQPLQTKPWLRP